MNKRMLIISPYFAPSNAADMHRIRTSLNYYEQYGWTPEVVAVGLQQSDVVCDEMLLESIPAKTIIHRVSALKKSMTGKVGLGSIALRSLPFYFSQVNKLLSSGLYELIFFSTTQFPVLVLARYWKARYSVKIVFDIQDPWHTDYYRNKPKTQRPRKYWFSYHLNKFLEPVAMKAADGIISVSQGYIETLQQRYPHLEQKPVAVIPFGMHLQDLAIAKAALQGRRIPGFQTGKFNLVYVGRGGYDLIPALERLLAAMKLGIVNHPILFNKLHVHLLGTSYAAAGKGLSTCSKVIELAGFAAYFTEKTDRLPYYDAINILKAADMLFIPGPDDPAFIASKIFPYLMVERPLLAILHQACSALPVLEACDQVRVFKLDQHADALSSDICEYLKSAMEGTEASCNNLSQQPQSYSSEALTKAQTILFDKVCSTGI